MDWNICTEEIKRPREGDPVEVVINKVTYHLDQNFAALTHCFSLLLDQLEEINNKIENVVDMIDEVGKEIYSIGMTHQNEIKKNPFK